MNVKELSEKLEKCDPQTEVCIMDDPVGPLVSTESASEYFTNVLDGKVFILKSFKGEIRPNGGDMPRLTDSKLSPEKP